jgi:hypothetical protein
MPLSFRKTGSAFVVGRAILPAAAFPGGFFDRLAAAVPGTTG